MSPRLPSWERRHGHHGASWRGALAHSPDTLQTLCSRRAAIVSLTPLTKIHTSKTRVHTHGRRKYAGAARIVTIVELHVTYYSPRAWACYQELLDPTLNWGGYGYDVWLQNYMVDHCALREPKMGILDRYSATHAHQWFRKEAGPVGPKLWLAARAHNGSRVYQMRDMEEAMRQRGTPVRHACSHRQASTCERDSLSSTESPSNESILQLQKMCSAKDCSCGWASQGVCAATSDDGSITGSRCWSACCSPFLSHASVQQAEQHSLGKT